MRLAIHHDSEVAVRTGQILLAERGLERLGLVDRPPRLTGDTRVERADDFTDYSVVVSDAEDPGFLIARALAGGASLCLWRDIDVEDYDADFQDAGLTLLTGANLATGIAPALAAHETALAGTVMDVTVGWTEPGRPLRRGQALVFPDPVGARWGTERPSKGGRAYAAPIGGEWAGAMARVTSAHEDGVLTRVVGVADLAPHLEALALAAGALAVAGGAFPPGIASPDEGADAYLAAALQAGLDVAAFAIPGA